MLIGSIKGYIRKDILTAENVGTEDYEVKGGANYIVGQGYMPTQSEIDSKKPQVQLHT